MKTAPTNKKIREIITLVKEGKLVPRPEFQRRLVWTREDKNHFLDSVLKGYPFPEIYLADGEVDLETGQGTQLLVDGLQRVNTMIQYFFADPELKLTTVPNYRDLPDGKKQAFLQYDVAVRDLGAVTRDQIVEVFRRINATNYALNDIEVNNAVYAGAFKQFAEQVASNPIFSDHKIFTSRDLKRMGDLRFALSVIIGILGGYTNRDDAFEAFLDKYNDDFECAEPVRQRLDSVFDFLNECGFDDRSRIWRKADLYTAVIELDRIINLERIRLQPSEAVERLTEFFETIDSSSVDSSDLSGMYYKAALQASNDRVNRVRRGIIFAGVVKGIDESQIRVELSSAVG
ncbi:MAG: DUF262 domain-containing protein [Acetobacteraceae bacterium]|nr:DUF262 domain-containing protein [Acetobacteraceae bacterium]MBV8523799.1 DUF262 domain-containing protein [Acetobacteraceae bacterium]